MTDRSGPDAGLVGIVMAAGKSTRMKSDLPKVMHNLCGRPLLAYVLDALRAAGVKRLELVVGFGADLVRREFASQPDVEFVVQEQQKGTGHAVMVCQDALKGHRGPVFVLAGDGPFVRPVMLQNMLTRFHEQNAKCLMATATIDNPLGYGRIIRDASGGFDRIVEQKDATPDEAAVREINPSFYLFDGPALFDALAAVKPNNSQGEYYITDAPGILKQRREVVRAEQLADAIDIFGINTREHLAEAHVMMQRRIQSALMESGVTIVDPRNTVIDVRATIGRDTVVEPFTVIEGLVEIGANCRIGPFGWIKAGAKIADGATAK